MLIHHVIGPGKHGNFLVVYTRPHCRQLVAVLDCLGQPEAEREADRLNREQAAKQTAPWPTGIKDRSELRTIAGFYADE